MGNDIELYSLLPAGKSGTSNMGRDMKRHKLKILPQYFEAQISGVKNFEIRKDDRSFKVGDELQLNEISDKLGVDTATGRSCTVKVTYKIVSYPENEFEGIEPGYCILGTELINK